jgi:hypothetical protein
VRVYYSRAIRLGTAPTYKGRYRLPWGAHITSDDWWKPWEWFHLNDWDDV